MKWERIIFKNMKSQHVCEKTHKMGNSFLFQLTTLKLRVKCKKGKRYIYLANQNNHNKVNPNYHRSEATDDREIKSTSPPTHCGQSYGPRGRFTSIWLRIRNFRGKKRSAVIIIPLCHSKLKSSSICIL